MRLQGKVALVTGAARGIGRAIALGLADAGADVALADLGGAGEGWSYRLADQAELDAAAGAVRERGVRALSVACDVTDAAGVASLIEGVTKELGRLDLLVNNAGIVLAGGVATFEEADWDRIMAVNVKGTFLMSRAAIPALAETRGAIVNIASIAGKRGYAGMAAYCASKFAVVGFTQALSQELGRLGIRANAICPGFLGTAMWTDHLSKVMAAGSGVSSEQAFQDFVSANTPLGRAQEPADIAGAVVYLATAENVSGVALNVAGGAEVW